MDLEILEHLRGITPEEQAILQGRDTIDRALYMPGQENTISRKKLLEAGKRHWKAPPSTRSVYY